MKAIMILGAIAGFGIGTGFGLLNNSPWPTTLWRACVASLVAAVLARWWSSVWIKSLHEAIEQRRSARNLPTVQVQNKPINKL